MQSVYARSRIKEENENFARDFRNFFSKFIMNDIFRIWENFWNVINKGRNACFSNMWFLNYDKFYLLLFFDKNNYQVSTVRFLFLLDIYHEGFLKFWD